MRDAHGKTWWWVVAGLALSVTAPGTARADMVYFKNGNSMWAEEAGVEGDEVIVTRGGRTERFPMADVDRVEKKRTNMPDYKVDVPPPPGVGGPPGSSVVRGGPGSPPGGPPGASPTGVGRPGPGGPQGVIPIPGGGSGGPGQPQFGPPGAGQPAGPPFGGPPPGAPPGSR